MFCMRPCINHDGCQCRMDRSAKSLGHVCSSSKFLYGFARTIASNRGRPMRQTDIAIVGGGLGGSAAAAMLGRAGIDTVLIDPHRTYPPDFRCEKLDHSQVELVHKAGLAEVILPAAVLDRDVAIAR